MTFFPSSGFGKFTPEKWDEKLGKKIYIILLHIFIQEVIMDNEEILNEGIEVNHIFDIGLVYKHSFYEKKYRVIIF